jgi:hypothetical protein
MPEGIVDALEVIEVDDEDGQGQSVAAGAVDLLAQAVVEGGARQRTGQRIAHAGCLGRVPHQLPLPQHRLAQLPLQPGRDDRRRRCWRTAVAYP